MRANIKRVTITLDETEALSVRNALIKGLGDKHIFEPSSDLKGAADLLRLLTGIFNSSVPDIHRPK